jgi:hypothetical protein
MWILSHIPSYCWFTFFAGSGMLVMSFALRDTETIPKWLLRLILGFCAMGGLMALTFSILAAISESRQWIAYEEAIARLTANDCTVEVNGKVVVERESFLRLVRKIEEIQRKRGSRRKYDVLLQTESETFHFELWEDVGIPNEYGVMFLNKQQEPFRIGTVGSPELRELLIQYDRKKSG